MAIVINELDAVAEPPASGAPRDAAAADRRPVEPQRLVPALSRIAARTRRTWAH